MQTMYDDGMCKALAGLTTIEEVLQVTRDVHDGTKASTTVGTSVVGPAGRASSGARDGSTGATPPGGVAARGMLRAVEKVLPGAHEA